ncbi:MAG: hypothetical protein SF187_12055 [Deltaproteobacteria bacterium]|nr:hypothetical protein [Deltaproteobacteria bacterium]
MTIRTKLYLPAALCFVSLFSGCFNGYKPPSGPGEDYCQTSDPCLQPGDACFNRCPSGSSCDPSTNICATHWSPPPVDAQWQTPTADAASPPRFPDAGVGPDVGGTSPPSACSACEQPPPNTPTPIVTPLCQFNHQCGPGGRCFDGACQAACTSSASCGTGDVCLNGFCQADPDGGDACVFSSQCGDGVCINGTCHAECTTSCANAADVCEEGVCKPNRNPSPECKRTIDCAGSGMCVNGVCRTPCADDRSCGAGTSGWLCVRGYCVAPQEVAPQCGNNSHCDADKSCVNAICCTP